MKWAIWEDPEDNSSTLCLAGSPHHGSLKSVQVHSFEAPNHDVASQIYYDFYDLGEYVPPDFSGK